MTHAYSELYLNDAKKSLATMFDYVVYDCEYNIDWMVELFLKSGYAKRFEKGNSVIIGGIISKRISKEVWEKNTFL